MNIPWRIATLTALVLCACDQPLTTTAYVHEEATFRCDNGFSGVLSTPERVTNTDGGLNALDRAAQIWGVLGSYQCRSEDTDRVERRCQIGVTIQDGGP